MSIKILVEFVFSDEDLDKAKVLLEKLRDESLKEPGCIRYEVYRVSSEPAFALFEEFENSEAIEFHKTTSHYKEILKVELEELIQQKIVKRLE